MGEEIRFDVDLSRPPRPLMQHGRSYELLDLAGKPLGRYLLLREVIEAIREAPARTTFAVRLWTGRHGSLTLEKQWYMCLGLDGVMRAAQWDGRSTGGPRL